MVEKGNGAQDSKICGSRKITKSFYEFTTSADFQQYYHKNCRPLASLTNALKLLQDPRARREAESRVKNYINTRDYGRPFGWFGEVVLSYIIETEHETFGRSMVITSAAWHAGRGKVAEHVDLVGIDLASGIPHYAEVKTSSNPTSEDVLGISEELRKQLSRKRIDKWRLAGSTEHVAAIIARLLEIDRISHLEFENRDWVSTDHYHRIGSILTNSMEYDRQLDNCVPVDVSTAYPVHILRVHTNDLRVTLEDLVKLDLALERAGK